MIGIIDYGKGNLRSVENALKKLGYAYCIASDPDVLAQCEKLILPGVGAFADCMAEIHKRNLFDAIKQMVQEGKPLLGICLGMQMLYEASEENGYTEGFGFLKGTIRRLETDLPVPQIGWNELEWEREHPLQEVLSPHPFVYYVHSYYASDTRKEECIAGSMYGDIKVPGLVQKGNVTGTQFHPEKSGDDGLEILNYFMKEGKA